MGIKDGIAIWAKLKQGNGRGTCCWSTHNIITCELILIGNYNFFKAVLNIEDWKDAKIVGIIALRGCLDTK